MEKKAYELQAQMQCNHIEEAYDYLYNCNVSIIYSVLKALSQFHTSLLQTGLGYNAIFFLC